MGTMLRLAGLTVALLGALPLAGCGRSDDSTLNVVAIGDPGDPFELGARLSLSGQLVRASTAEGLVAFDEEGRVVPALADRWIVTDDGQSYLFRLRDGNWQDGTPLTAASARVALRRAIRGLRGTSLGLDLAGVDDIRVMAARVIEIRLSQPMPDLLQLLAQPELGLRRKGKGVGPLNLQREDGIAVLTPIKPEDRGLQAVDDWEERIRTLRLSAMSGEEAVKRFNRGEADLLLGGRIEQFPLASSVGILRGTIQIDPVVGLFGLEILNSKGFLSTPENREAIAMAIDRDALMASFGVNGWIPSTRIVYPPVEGGSDTPGERWADLDLKERRSRALARVAAWRAEQNDGAPVRLTIELPAGPGSDLLFAQLQNDLALAGVTAERLGGKGAPDLRLVDDVARYPRASWFLNRLNCTTRRSLCDGDADALVARSRKTVDPVERAALLAQAEQKLSDSNVFIPFGAPIRWSLVRGSVVGFSPNRLGWHPLMPMALRPN